MLVETFITALPDSHVLASLRHTLPDAAASQPGEHERYAAWTERLAQYAASGDHEAKTLSDALETGLNGRHALKRLHAYSPYLSALLAQEADAGAALLTSPLKHHYRDLINQLAGLDTAAASHDSIMTALRHAKKRLHLITALADWSEVWGLDQITGALSLGADACIRAATRFLLHRLATRHNIDWAHQDYPERGSGLIILAMGKLGAGELNYSSDIDLIILYDPEACPLDRYTAPKAYADLARDLTALLEQRTRDGYVFRTDLRLRPDPASTPPAIALPSAIRYYQSQALTWERAAMIKARPVIGDPGPVRQLMAVLDPFVWRAGADFTAIEDIQDIKRKIDAAQTEKSGPNSGHNVKLGRGGIRQIEFFAQAHQLLFASQNPGLKAKPTREILRELVASKRLSLTDQQALDEAYCWHRQIEHRLQMREDQQTHQMPDDTEGLRALADSLNLSTDALLKTHNAHRQVVSAQYDRLFDRGRQDRVSTAPTPTTPDKADAPNTHGFQNPDKAAAIIAGWQTGAYPATKSERGRDLLDQILPRLLTAFGAMPDPDSVLVRFDAFLASLNAGVPVFALIKNSERLPELFAKILGAAPALADLITRRPRLLEAALDMSQGDAPLSSWHQLENELKQQLSIARDYEDCLDICRRWTARHRFRAALYLLDGQVESDAVGQFLARLAEICLAALQPIVEDDFARRHGRFPGGGMAIIAMGNLASGQITLTSDLDLVLVYRVDPRNKQSDGDRPLSPNEYWIKLAARLVSAITSPTAEGRLYDVDLRLRPQGDSGPLAVSLESFAQYQDSDAWTWEHMALTRARTITGDIDLKARIDALVFKTLTAPRDAGTLRHDVAAMRRRMATQHKAASIWQLKHARGGLVDIQFIAQYLILRHAHDFPHIISASSGAALERCAQAGLIGREMANELIDAHRLYRRVRSYLRLIAPDGQPFDPHAISPLIRTQLARVILGQETAKATIDFDQATAHLNEVMNRTFRYFTRLIDDPAAAP